MTKPYLAKANNSDVAPWAASGLCTHYDATRRLLWLRLSHGRANEIASTQLGGFEALCDLLEGNVENSSIGPVHCFCTVGAHTSSKGTPLFISGADVLERKGWTHARLLRHLERQRTLMARIRKLPVFTVGLVNGVAYGWGAEYLLATDYCIATPAARIALPETGLGIVPGAGGSTWLHERVGRAQALRLGCTGEVLDAAAARDVGYVQENLESVEQAMLRIETMASSLAKRSPTAIAEFKAAVTGPAIAGHEAFAAERRAYLRCLASGDALRGREAFKDIVRGSPPEWGARYR